MKKIVATFLTALLVAAGASAQVLQRPLSFRGLSQGITYFMFGTSLQEFQPSPSHGEVAIRHSPGGAPELVIWDAFSGGWKANSFISTMTLAPTVDTLSGSQTWNAFTIDITNTAPHSGALNYARGIFLARPDVDSPNVTEQAIVIDPVWDEGIRFESSSNQFNFNFLGGALWNIGSGSVTHQIGITPQSGFRFFTNIGPGKLNYFASSIAPGVFDGSDINAALRYGGWTDVNHTGTGNILAVVHADTITSPDAELIHASVLQNPGWDVFGLAAVGGTAWAPTDNPPAGYVGVWFRQGIAASQNCSIMARLASGVDVEIVALVANNVCP